MTAAILFRGHTYRDIGTERPWGVDWRRCIESQRKYLIEPLEQQSTIASIFLSSYMNQYADDIELDYDAFRKTWRSGSGTQKQVFLDGLKLIDGDYDLIVVCRFDLELLSNPMEHPNFDPDKICFLWREWNEHSWNDHKRVPDAIHFIPGRFLNGFRKGIEETPSDTCLHLIYRPVAKHVGEENINIIYRDGFIDSNTDTMLNPVYKMVRIKS